MKVKEIIDYYYCPVSETIEVSFRMKGDPETQMREDEFDLLTTKDYGYFILDSDYPESKEFLYEYEEDTDELVLGDEPNFNEIRVDTVELRNFLNEFYGEDETNLPDLVPF
jgi:hypothetical protein